MRCNRPLRRGLGKLWHVSNKQVVVLGNSGSEGINIFD